MIDEGPPPSTSQPQKFGRFPKTGGGLSFQKPNEIGIILGKSDNKGFARKQKDKEKNTIRGKEVTIRDSAAPAQVIYGEMRVGGVTTMVHTTGNTAAYLQTGEENSETYVESNGLLWTAKTPGAGGNNLTIEIEDPGPSYGTTVCNYYSGGRIVVTPSTDGSGNPTATLNQVISAVAANAPADSFIRVQKTLANTNGKVNFLEQTSLQYGGGSILHMIVTLAGHEIDSVQKLYLDGSEVLFERTPGTGVDTRWATGRYDSRVFMAVNKGADDQVAIPDCIAQVPDIWTENHRQRGNAHVYLIFQYNESVFPSNLPEIEFLVRGKKCYDPRTSVTQWTRNAALIIYDYLRDSRYGLDLSSIVDNQGWIDAANACDESIPRTGAPDEARYEFDTSFDPTEGAENILEQMEQGIAGKIFTRDGKVFVYPGKWRAPTVTFTETDLRGDLRINTHVSRSDRFNCARGTFMGGDYQETDIPPVKNSTYITEDGGEIYEDFPLNFVRSPTQAQRILKIELEKVRQGFTVTVPLKLSGLLVCVGDTVNLYLERYGWEPKIFEVMNSQIVVEDDGVIGVDLELRETAEGVYAWDNGEETEIDVAPNTTLPSATDVEPPTAILCTSGTDELYINSDGKVVSRLKVSWTPSTAQFVVSGGKYQIRHRKFGSGENDWIATAEEPDSASFHYILDVQDGQTYYVAVRALNSIGIPSDWVFPFAATHTVVGKTAPPSDVTNFTASITDYGTSFNWEAIPDLDAGEYEIRVGSSFESGVLVWKGKGNTARWEYRLAGTSNFWIKSYDTSLNPSTNAALSQLQILPPESVVILARLDGPNVLFEWNTPTEGAFKIQDYIISYGPTYAGSITVATVSANNYLHRVDWGLVRTFWVVARDIAGNLSTATAYTLNILPPNSAQAFAVRTVGNNVLLDWRDPVPSSLPIAYYNVWKGDTYAAAIKIGEKYGSFHAYLEQFGGTFYYHVEGVDTAGNVGAHATAVGVVSAPDDFYIKNTINLLVEEGVELLNAVAVPRQPQKEQNDIFFPIDTVRYEQSQPLLINPIEVTGVETFENWWDINGWNNLQDAINEGYDGPFLSPTSTVPGQIKWTVDYEVTFASSYINFQYELSNKGDEVTVIPTIRVSADGLTYTEHVGNTQVFAENFRYVEYILNFQATTDKAFAKLTLAKAQISLQRQTEYLIVEVDAGDAATGGTPFTFTKDFLDIEDIQATLWGVAANLGIPIINFEDDPNPTGGKALLFNLDGDPINGQLRVQATGAVNP